MNQNDFIKVPLTIEDEFTLTRIRNGAHELRGKARDQYLWSRIVRLVCRERAYKYVTDELGLVVDPNIGIFDDVEAVDDSN